MPTLCFSGAADRNRTGDLLITNQLLYQLSYSSKRGTIIAHYPLRESDNCFESPATAGRRPVVIAHRLRAKFDSFRAQAKHQIPVAIYLGLHFPSTCPG